jgi:WD40 repeat protein
MRDYKRRATRLLLVVLFAGILRAQFFDYDQVLKAQQRAEQAHLRFIAGIVGLLVFLFGFLLVQFAKFRRRIRRRKIVEANTPPPMAGVATFLRILAWLCLAAALVVVSLYTYACAVSDQSPSRTPVLLLAGLLWLQRYLRRQSAMLKTPLGAQLLATDRRPCIVFLRGFSEEEVDLKSWSWWSPPSPWLLEDTILRVFKNLGPVVGLTNPTLRGRPTSYSPIDATSANWQEKADDLIKRSAVIVLIIAESPGVEWEIGYLRRCGYLARTIFVFPPAKYKLGGRSVVWLGSELGFTPDIAYEVLDQNEKQDGQPLVMRLIAGRPRVYSGDPNGNGYFDAIRHAARDGPASPLTLAAENAQAKPPLEPPPFATADEALAWLGDFPELLKQLRARGGPGMLQALKPLSDDAGAHLLRSAMTLAVPALADDPNQFAGQLLGRIAPQRSGALHPLLAQAASWNEQTWLQPQTTSLTAAGCNAVRLLHSHTDFVRSVAITADGSYGISGGSDATVKIWDLNTGMVIQTLTHHTDRVWNVAVTADGTRYASAANDGTLRVWSLAVDGSRMIQSGYSERFALSAKGTRVARACKSPYAFKIWDSDSGRAVAWHRDYSVRRVTSLGLDENGSRLVCGYDDGSLELWNCDPTRQLWNVQAHEGEVSRVVFTDEDQKIVSASHDGTTKVWAAETHEELLRLQTGRTLEIAVSPDGTRAVTVFSDESERALRVWDLKTGQLKCTLQQPYVTTVALAADGRRCISGDLDQTVILWDLAATAQDSGQRAYRLLRCAALGRDGSRAVFATSDGKLEIYHLATGSYASVPLPVESRQTAVSAEADWVVMSNKARKFMLWNFSQQTDPVWLKEADWISAVAINRDGTRAIAASADDFKVRVWDSTSKELIHVFEGHIQPVYALVQAGDGKSLLSISNDGVLTQWDINTGSRIHAMQGRAGTSRVALHSDGKVVLQGRSDGTVNVWEISTGVEWTAPWKHSDAVSGVALSDDGKFGVSVSLDRTVRMLDLVTKECVAVFTADEKLLSCAISQDGQTITAGGSGRPHYLKLVKAATQ